MFTRADLSTLLDVAPTLGASIYLPTHQRSTEIRQDAIQLKNLVQEAQAKLEVAGVRGVEAAAMLEPISALTVDTGFWLEQDAGLALFLDCGSATRGTNGNGSRLHVYRVPVPLEPCVVVGPGFHITPLLPLLGGDGAYLVVAVTADRVRVLEGSRFALAEVAVEDMPTALADDEVESDHEHNVQSGPAGRPYTGTGATPTAQAYGDAPAEWRKSRLVAFTRRIAAAIDHRVGGARMPVVLVADPELAGHIHKQSTHGDLITVVEANPEAMDGAGLHAAAYAVVLPGFEQAVSDAIDKYQALRGNDTTRTAVGVADLVKASVEGRVDTLLLREGDVAWGRYDRSTGDVVSEEVDGAQDLYSATAAWTIQHGGTVHVTPPEQMPEPEGAAAILRY